LPEWVQKFKEPRTEIKKIAGGFYKYEVEYRYSAELKRTQKITKRLLGKITEDEGFVKSDKHGLREELAKLHNVDIKMFGVYKMFTSLLADEINGISAIFDDETSQKLLSIAMLRFAFQSPIKRMQNYHSHDFCSEFWAVSGLTDKQVTATLKLVGENRQKLVAWMKSRLVSSGEEKSDLVMIDSTHIQTLSENLHVNAKGYNPNHDYDPQVRLMYIFSAQLKQPVYYRLINGNITDISSMKQCVSELDAENVIFIADKGFYSDENTKTLDSNNLQYIIPLHRNNSLIDFAPLQTGDFKRSMQHFIYQDRAIWFYQYESKGKKIITFLDNRLRTEEENDYLLRVKSHPEEYTIEKFRNKLDVFGTLTITYKTNKTLTAREIYESYKQRNEIEILFDSYKNFIEADRMYMQDRYVLEGWLMANFIAMIAYYRLYTALKSIEKLSNYSPKDIIELSKSIHKTRVRGEWKTSEITKKNIDLFKKLGIDYLK
jgi:hypothetical protein